jgi:hypothetical protein
MRFWDQLFKRSAECARLMRAVELLTALVQPKLLNLVIQHRAPRGIFGNREQIQVNASRIVDQPR